jgi:FKBP-type peptidyl-prolyl cis-trans isomerase FkpA
MKVKTIFFLLILTLTISCKPKNQKGIPELVNNRESLMRINKFLVNKDNYIIKNFVARQKWQMQVTKTGLWYELLNNGKGNKAVTGKKAMISYKILLLDGQTCYFSKPGETKEFRIGQGGVESGLEEGILLMKEGQRARFILPPHLAYGLTGDNNKIPPRAILIYEVELLAIKD